jgi:hypothetical protein
MVHKTYIACFKFFDRDRNLKISLLPGLEAQQVEKHCYKTFIFVFRFLLTYLLHKKEIIDYKMLSSENREIIRCIGSVTGAPTWHFLVYKKQLFQGFG